MELKKRKEQIESFLSQGNVEASRELIEEYEKQYPDDIDVIAMKTRYNLLAGKIETAMKLALQGVRRLPLNADMYYNLACVYRIIGNKVLSYINFEKANFLYASTQKGEKIKELGLNEKKDAILQEYTEEMEQTTNKEKLIQLKQDIDRIMNISKNNFGFMDHSFRDLEQIVGDYCENEFEKRFVGVFKDQFLSYYSKAGNMDVIHIKGEFIKAEDGKTVYINNLEQNVEYLLPIACSQEGTIHFFEKAGNSNPIAQYFSNHFNYYRITNNTKVTSSNKSYYGKPISLKPISRNKRVVLSIFVDGLSQQILQGEAFKEIMPYTYEYFKNGIIFNHAYNAAEWTYPSIVNYVTGLDTTHHMLFHNELDCRMPLDVPTLAEYFQRHGYYTAMFSGDWRIIPPYGHARGYDRFVYQNATAGFKVYEVISDTINHLEAFKETNQYVWLTIGDLHDIADDLDLPVEVQKDLPLTLRTYEDKGVTSAKQDFSKNKKESYLRQAKYVDRWLHILYSYLEENYKEKDIVVSLFSDHGQGYLIGEGKHFLSKERSNVAFMFKGGLAKGQGVVNEIVSSCDYSLALRKIVDMEALEDKTDGRLPKVFGGVEEREWALTESIHPEDFYQAAIFASEETFFFINEYPVEDDGRFKLNNYQWWLEDLQGNIIQDEKLGNKYLDIILKHIAPVLIYE